jgi:ribosomal protein S18 acetylase RimI-like enzyme
MMAVPDIVSRRALPSDLSALLTLLQHYYTEHDIWLRDSPEKTASDLSDLRLGFFVAEINGSPAGCVLLRTLLSIPSATECKRLFVTPQLRNRGLAGKLMDTAETRARTIGLHWIYLDSRSDMTSAIALYRRRDIKKHLALMTMPRLPSSSASGW